MEMSDVFEVFKVYKAWVELDSGKKIKCLRTDNGEWSARADEQNLVRKSKSNVGNCKLGKIILVEDTDGNVDGKAGKLFRPSYIWKSCVPDVQYPRNYKAGSKIQKVLVLRSNDSSEAIPQHEVNETDESHAPVTRTLNRERRRLGWQADYVIESNVAYCLLTEEGEPSTLQEALNNPDASFWKEAMQE
ncbi:hypothetical protein Tco_0649140 [Tanacetum coccineum]